MRYRLYTRKYYFTTKYFIYDTITGLRTAYYEIKECHLLESFITTYDGTRDIENPGNIFIGYLNNPNELLTIYPELLV